MDHLYHRIIVKSKYWKKSPKMQKYHTGSYRNTQENDKTIQNESKCHAPASRHALSLHAPSAFQSCRVQCPGQHQNTSG